MTIQKKLRKRAALNRAAAEYLATHMEHDDSQANRKAADLEEAAADRIDALERRVDCMADELVSIPDLVESLAYAPPEMAPYWRGQITNAVQRALEAES